jgi:tellurite resistance protein
VKSPLHISEFPTTDQKVLSTAVSTVLTRHVSDTAAPSVGPRSLAGRLPTPEQLAAGAAQLVAESDEDTEAAGYVTALLETAFLVSSADGLAEQELRSLGELMVQSTGAVLGADAFGSLVEKFEQLLTEQGLEARVGAVAKHFDDFLAREEAMSFAALIAVADGELGTKEALVLLSLGKRLGFSPGEVQAVVNAVANELSRVLKQNNPG